MSCSNAAVGIAVHPFTPKNPQTVEKVGRFGPLEETGMTVPSFEKGGTGRIFFSEYDDLLAWEAFEIAAEEWKARTEELRACMTS